MRVGIATEQPVLHLQERGVEGKGRERKEDGGERGRRERGGERGRRERGRERERELGGDMKEEGQEPIKCSKHYTCTCSLPKTCVVVHTPAAVLSLSGVQCS